MEGSRKKKGRRTSGTVAVGERSSLLSSAIFVLLSGTAMFATVLFGAVDTITWVFLSIFWALLILLWMADAWRGGGILVNTSTLLLPVLGLLMVGLVQVALGLTLDAFATRIFLVHLTVYVTFAAACLTYINNEGRVRKTVVAIIIFGTIMAFAGILQKLANPDAIYGLRQTPQAKGFGPFVNQHHFAAFMEMTGGVTLGLLFGKRTGRDKRILLAIAVLIMGIAVLFTSSRGGVLGFLAALAFVGALNFFSGKRSREKEGRDAKQVQRKAVIAVSAAALIALMFGSVLLLGGNEELFRGIGATEIQDGVTNGRAHFWPIALRIFLEHPIFGAGFDAFGVAFTRHDSWNGLLRVEQAHNDYLQTLADAGLVGFACIAAFIFLLFRKGWAVISSSRGSRRDAAIGALAGCFGILLHSFFDFPLRTPSNLFYFLILCTVATAQVRSGSRKRKSSTAD
jgi:O-antigen ligase